MTIEYEFETVVKLGKTRVVRVYKRREQESESIYEPTRLDKALKNKPSKPKPKPTSKSISRTLESISQWNSRLGPNEYSQRRLWFGRHINVMLKDVPISYIKWGVKNLPTDKATLFARELMRRDPYFLKRKNRKQK